MDNIGGYVNPLRLLQRMPEGMAIHNLRDRLVHIIADFRTQTSLREGCNTILHTDCLLLAQVRYAAHIWFQLHSCLLTSSRLLCLPGRCPLLQRCSAIVSGVTTCCNTIAESVMVFGAGQDSNRLLLRTLVGIPCTLPIYWTDA